MSNNQQADQPRRMPENEVLSARDALAGVMAELECRRDELTHILPKDVSFDSFAVSANQALRNNPRLLKCTGPSLVNALVKAAYDGLKIDGKEAAIVDAKESYKVGSVWKERIVARYMPMVFGLIKQILQSGLVLDVKAVIVYSAEVATGRFQLLEGTNPGIHHEPILSGEKGSMVGAYSIALLKNGARTFEWMDAAAILDVRKESKTDKVWDRWPTEMWKKTVVRRHRKTLPSTKDIVDSEAIELFPQFDRTTPHPQFAQIGHNSGAKPTRASIEQGGAANGTPLDLGGSRDDDRGEVIDQRREDSGASDAQATSKQRRAEVVDAKVEPDIETPQDAVEWESWADYVKVKILGAASPAALDQIWTDAQPVLRHAANALKDRLTGILTDRNADLALEGNAGAGTGGAK